eukprot:scaffold2312_cov165-Ochromonas_danica.AAC.11
MHRIIVLLLGVEIGCSMSKISPLKEKGSTMDVCGSLSTTSQRPQCRSASVDFAAVVHFGTR